MTSSAVVPPCAILTASRFVNVRHTGRLLTYWKANRARLAES